MAIVPVPTCKLELVYLPEGKYWVYPKNGLQAGHCDSPGIMSDWRNFQNNNINKWNDYWSENDSETKCQMEK